MVFLFFCLEFFLLFFLSGELTKHLSRLLHLIFRSQTVVIHVLSFLFLPGVVLHELSHMFVASVLFVPTGEVEFFPEIHGNEVKMGSVAIGKTDPLRRFLIGVAPIFGGLSMLFIAFWYLSSGTLFLWENALLLYAVFQIGNTMFSSKKDMEGALGFGGALVFVGGILQIFQVPVWNWVLQAVQNSLLITTLMQMNWFLLIAVGIDLVVLAAVAGVQHVFYHGS